MIVEALLKMLIGIHKQEPISGRILALGKQTVAVPMDKILAIFEENECAPNPNFDLAHVKRDIHTRVRQEYSIEDADLFRLFGENTYETMDVSDYEHASIIHDLNDPIPKELEGKFDFIVDGGTFDHLFDIKTAFSNVVRLLKPGGRIFQWNAASNYANAGYISFGADYFYDYYTLNRFADCRTYFAESHSIGAQNWAVYEFRPSQTTQSYSPFRTSPFYVMTLVYAKKQAASTYDKMPVQLQYRDETLRKEYRLNAESFPDTERFLIKPMDIKKTDMSSVDRKRYKRLDKPDSKAYHSIGWL